MQEPLLKAARQICEDFARQGGAVNNVWAEAVIMKEQGKVGLETVFLLQSANYELGRLETVEKRLFDSVSGLGYHVFTQRQLVRSDSSVLTDFRSSV